MNTPDFDIVLLIHRTMRNDARRMQHSVEEMHRADRRTRGNDLVQWFRGYHGELLDHHEVEDTIVFNRLSERARAAWAQVAQIDQDHAALHDVLEACRVSLDSLADPGVSWESARGWALASISALIDLLDRHLDFEERGLLPLLGRYFTPDERAAMDAEAKGHMSLAQASFTVPWLLDSCTPEERSFLLGGAPRSFRILWRLTRGGYERLADRALGGVPIDATVA